MSEIGDVYIFMYQGALGASASANALDASAPVTMWPFRLRYPRIV